jgi:hypothetical protein
MAKAHTKSSVAALAGQLIAGTNKHLASVTQVMVAGGSFTPAQVISQLQAIVTLRSDVETAKAATKAKLATEKADMPELRVFLDAFVTFVKAAFGTSPDALADFGLHPKKAKAPATVTAKAAAAAKREATRKARNTMGSQQRKLVKGDVTGVIVTPITAAPPVVAPPAPNGPGAPAGSTPAGTAPHTA